MCIDVCVCVCVRVYVCVCVCAVFFIEPLYGGNPPAKFEISPQTDKLNFLIKHHHEGKFQCYYSVHDSNHSGVGRTFVGLSNELCICYAQVYLYQECSDSFSPQTRFLTHKDPFESAMTKMRHPEYLICSSTHDL